MLNLFLNTPKWLFISGPGHLAHAKKKEKQHQIKEVYLAPFKTRQNRKNLCFPKSKQSFKNHNFLCDQKILKNQ
jgi:hypothetical protein